MSVNVSHTDYAAVVAVHEWGDEYANALDIYSWMAAGGCYET